MHWYRVRMVLDGGVETIVRAVTVVRAISRANAHQIVKRMHGSWNVDSIDQLGEYEPARIWGSKQNEG